MKIQVFDPPMCCSSGVCGPSVNPALIQFAADLEWLEDQGVEVERFNLAQQPAAFVSVTAVKDALAKHGNACLPLTLVDGKVVCKGDYPTRRVLAALAQRTLSSETIETRASPSCCGQISDGVPSAKKKGMGCC